MLRHVRGQKVMIEVGDGRCDGKRERRNSECQW
jgi:hypothetical protein